MYCTCYAIIWIMNNVSCSIMLVLLHRGTLISDDGTTHIVRNASRETYPNLTSCHSTISAANNFNICQLWVLWLTRKCCLCLTAYGLENKLYNALMPPITVLSPIIAIFTSCTANWSDHTSRCRIGYTTVISQLFLCRIKSVGLNHEEPLDIWRINY